LSDKREKLRRVGLHYCGRYRNVVRYNPDFCGACQHCGLRKRPDGDPSSETCF